MKAFLVDVLMTSSCLGANSNCFVAPGEEPSPTSGSFSLGALDDHLVVGFLGGIVPVTLARLGCLILTGSQKILNCLMASLDALKLLCAHNGFLYNGPREFKRGRTYHVVSTN
jgi:hypothetical protein